LNLNNPVKVKLSIFGLKVKIVIHKKTDFNTRQFYGNEMELSTNLPGWFGVIEKGEV